MDVSPKVKDQLTDLATRTEAPTLTEVVRRALALYDLVVEHQDEGGSLVFRDSDGTEEVVRVL